MPKDGNQAERDSLGQSRLCGNCFGTTQGIGYKKQPKTLMLVGHNPGLEDLLIYLVGDGIQMAPDGKLLPTAAVAYLKMPNNWKDTGEGAGQLVSITRVKNISLS
jgi:phosphohistidine phosphatase SixA